MIARKEKEMGELKCYENINKDFFDAKNQNAERNTALF